MKKPAFEIAIASIVLSTNVVAQQQVVVPINNGMMPINPLGGGNASMGGMSGGTINTIPQGGSNASVSGAMGNTFINQGGVDTTMSGAMGNTIINQGGFTPLGGGGTAMIGASGGTNQMQYQPNISARQLQANGAMLLGAVSTPAGNAQAYRLPNSATTYYVFPDGKVFSK